MENRQKEILLEIQDMMLSIRSEMEKLDAKIYEFSQLIEDEDFTPLDLDLDIELELPEEDLPEDEVVDDFIELELEQEPKPELIIEQKPETVIELRPEPILESESEPVQEPKIVVEAISEAAQEKRAMIDKLTMHQAWRRDMPGSPVKDIRSAISLNDRVLFINSLFSEDASLFQETISKLNTMNELEEALTYLSDNFPAWEVDSEVVYRFMMAVRRRIAK